MLAESFCLAMAGGVAGVALAWAGLKLVLANAPIDLPRLDEVHLDARVLLFALGLSLVTAVLFGILPAWRASSIDPQRTLSTGSRTVTEGRRGLATRNGLVAFESALGAVLLIVAGLLVGSFLHVLGVDKGFDADRLVSAQVTLPQNSYGKGKQREAYYRRLIEKLQAIPGVTSAALVSRLPLQGEDWVDLIQKEGDKRPPFDLPPANYRFCSPDYFRAMGISFIAGRGFTEADRNRNLAVISETAARKIWPGENAIGKTFHRANPDEPPFQIAGVVRDVRVGPTRQPVVTTYVPYWYRSRLFMTVVLRTAMDPRAVLRPLRSAVWSIDPDTVVGEMRTTARGRTKGTSRTSSRTRGVDATPSKASGRAGRESSSRPGRDGSGRLADSAPSIRSPRARPWRCSRWGANRRRLREGQEESRPHPGSPNHLFVTPASAS